MPRLHSIEVEFRAKLKNGGVQLKVSVLNLGIYSTGWRVEPSNKEESGWWVQEPKHPDKYGRWRPCLEYNKKNGELWREMHQAIIEFMSTLDYDFAQRTGRLADDRP